MNDQQLFNDRLAVLATMHQKEKVIAPLLEQELGINVIVPQNFNTDIFGTFTREVKRPGTQIAAAKFKAEKALELTRGNLAIASEGNFTPHPLVPYIYSNREIVIFLDKINNLEIIGEEISIDTNFNHQIITNLDETYIFANKVGFPEHGLVVWFENLENRCNEITKGITKEIDLITSVDLALRHSPNNQVNIETDMRAMYNPTRMKNIAKATHNLLNKISSCCPKCNAPGFEITEIIQGLPCEFCHIPTTLPLTAIYQCKKCGFNQEKLFPNGMEFANPAQCMYCNP
ncbi:hypothetical protein I8751_28005 [Nostocaceae cyanobacterium CENA357]|uniref:DUF6671 domain-containing protein n=1 Tax=Atlanticothrix silvestris CENA357 TaxID=1725252 RepID=A0A8J7HMW8_9CYAN|nr:DUF6671 family protein [Atlanticothrix silvestris]MBH8556114.1 hypothetical protein [Atlanticothrix silvestris CENA357]